jgi:nucleoside-diphosphate-sugar epimerase
LNGEPASSDRGRLVVFFLREPRPLKLLFIGGTGNISAASTELARRRGHDVTILNRGNTADVSVPEGVRIVRGDARDEAAVRAAIGRETYDVVVQWIGYGVDQVRQDIRVFSGRTSQYVFISSAAAYQKPSAHFVITEATTLDNPHWSYARDKIACEAELFSAHENSGFPLTVVRPAHTYGPTRLPIWIGSWGTPYTIVDRMRRGRPVVVPGDGASLWTVTHSSDFAVGVVGLFGQTAAIGEAFHVTSDDVLSWNQIYFELGRAAGADPKLLHMATDFIVSASPQDAGTLLGDKIHSTVFDNSKLKRIVPGFSTTTTLGVGLRQAMAWFDADERRRKIDAAANDRWDRIIAAYERAVFEVCGPGPG